MNAGCQQQDFSPLTPQTHVSTRGATSHMLRIRTQLGKRVRTPQLLRSHETVQGPPAAGSSRSAQCSPNSPPAEPAQIVYLTSKERTAGAETYKQIHGGKLETRQAYHHACSVKRAVQSRHECSCIQAPSTGMPSILHSQWPYQRWAQLCLRVESAVRVSCLWMLDRSLFCKTHAKHKPLSMSGNLLVPHE